MKYLLLSLFLFFSCAAFTQDKYELSFEYAPSDTLGTGIGGHFSLSKVIAGKLSLGGAISAIKFNELKSMYYPLSLKVKVHPVGGMVSPFLLAEAGYGLYNHTENFSVNERYSSKGGLTYFGGAGISLRLVKIHPTLTVGYSSFTVKTSYYRQVMGVDNVTRTSDAFGGLRARLGIGF